MSQRSTCSKKGFPQKRNVGCVFLVRDRCFWCETEKLSRKQNWVRERDKQGASDTAISRVVPRECGCERQKQKGCETQEKRIFRGSVGNPIGTVVSNRTCDQRKLINFRPGGKVCELCVFLFSFFFFLFSFFLFSLWLSGKMGGKKKGFFSVCFPFGKMAGGFFFFVFLVSFLCFVFPCGFLGNKRQKGGNPHTKRAASVELETSRTVGARQSCSVGGHTVRTSSMEKTLRRCETDTCRVGNK